MVKDSGKSSRQIVVCQLQKRILYRCMHDVQSPLIAAGGYLELMELCLDNDKDPFKIERYRAQIREGVSQVSRILDQIRYTYSNESDPEGSEEPVKVDLNWYIQEVANNAASLAGKKQQEIVCETDGKNIHLKTDLFLLQLVIYTILLCLLKYTSKKSTLRIRTFEREGEAVAEFLSSEAERPAGEILKAVLGRDKTEREASQSDSGSPDAGEEALNLLYGTLSAEEPIPGSALLRLSFHLS